MKFIKSLLMLLMASIYLVSIPFFKVYTMEREDIPKKTEEDVEEIDLREIVINLHTQSIYLLEQIAKVILEIQGVTNPSISQTQQLVKEIYRSSYHSGMAKELSRSFLQLNASDQKKIANKIKELGIQNQQAWTQFRKWVEFLAKFAYPQIADDIEFNIDKNEEVLNKLLRSLLVFLPSQSESASESTDIKLNIEKLKQDIINNIFKLSKQYTIFNEEIAQFHKKIESQLELYDLYRLKQIPPELIIELKDRYKELSEKRELLLKQFKKLKANIDELEVQRDVRGKAWFLNSFKRVITLFEFASDQWTNLMADYLKLFYEILEL